jgi:hypothetical protein
MIVGKLDIHMKKLDLGPPPFFFTIYIKPRLKPWLETNYISTIAPPKAMYIPVSEKS